VASRRGAATTGVIQGSLPKMRHATPLLPPVSRLVGGAAGVVGDGATVRVTSDGIAGAAAAAAAVAIAIGGVNDGAAAAAAAAAIAIGGVNDGAAAAAAAVAIAIGGVNDGAAAAAAAAAIAIGGVNDGAAAAAIGWRRERHHRLEGGQLQRMRRHRTRR
jgi:hypothetical protein